MNQELKRVLIFSTAYFPHVGGAEIAIREITDRLPDYEFDLIAARLKPSLPSKEKIGNVTVHRVGYGIPWLDKIFLALFGQRRAVKLHNENSYDLMWSVMASYNSFAALNFKLQADVPFLLTLETGNSVEEIERKTKWVWWRFNRIFREADAVQSVTNHLMEMAKDKGFEGVFRIIPNGVDLDFFGEEFSEEELEKTREEFGFEEDIETVLITTSRLVKKNGVEDVIKAMEKLPESIGFVICGVGNLENKLKNLTQKLDLEDRVLFKGKVKHKKIPRLIKASDIFIRPSLSEGIGNSFLEAMACGVPVIGTQSGGIKDFLEDKETGFVCEPENPDSIAETVGEIMQLDKEEKDRITENAKSLISEKYNWDKIAKDMNDLFNKLCES